MARNVVWIVSLGHDLNVYNSLEFTFCVSIHAQKSSSISADFINLNLYLKLSFIPVTGFKTIFEGKCSRFGMDQKAAL